MACKKGKIRLPGHQFLYCPTKIKKGNSRFLNFSGQRIFCFLICQPDTFFFFLFKDFEFIRCEEPTTEFSTFYLLTFICNEMRPFRLVISLLNLRYTLLVTNQRICNFGQRVRSWWWNIKATQEGDHVNVIIQITHETNMKFQ